MSSIRSVFVVASLAALLGACTSTPVAPPAAPVKTQAPAPAPAPVAAPATPAPAPAATVAPKALPAYLDPASDIYKQRSVFFDFDKSLIKAEYADLVTKHGKFLVDNPTVAIKIEGNTDERGSSEYNLALGQRRAEAVRQALKLVGVKDSQMEAVSFGKEKPKATGHDEQSWAQNRRADLQYPAK